MKIELTKNEKLMYKIFSTKSKKEWCVVYIDWELHTAIKFSSTWNVLYFDYMENEVRMVMDWWYKIIGNTPDLSEIFNKAKELWFYSYYIIHMDEWHFLKFILHQKNWPEILIWYDPCKPLLAQFETTKEKLIDTFYSNISTLA